MRAILPGMNAVITAEEWATCQRSVRHGTHRFSAVTTTCVAVPLLCAARSQEPKCAKRNHETHVSTPAARYTKHENVALRTEHFSRNPLHIGSQNKGIFKQTLFSQSFIDFYRGTKNGGAKITGSCASPNQSSESNKHGLPGRGA